MARAAEVALIPNTAEALCRACISEERKTSESQNVLAKEICQSTYNCGKILSGGFARVQHTVNKLQHARDYRMDDKLGNVL